MGDGKVIFTPVERIPDERLWFQKKWKPSRLTAASSEPKFFQEHEISDGGAEARLLYPILGQCERCDDKAEQRHHKDRNRNNNARENIEFLCIPCHAKEHHDKRQQAVGGRAHGSGEDAARKA